MINLNKFQLSLLVLLPLLLIVFLFFSYQQAMLENESLKGELKNAIAQLQNSNSKSTVSKDKSSDISELNKDFPSKISEHGTTDNKTPINVVNEVSISNDENTEVNEVIPFEEQEIDYDWALPVENSITDTFMSHSYLTKYTLENVECRTTICEFTLSNVSIDSADAAVTVMFAFKDVDLMNEKTQTFRRSSRSEDGTLKLSVGRFKNSFE
jgi:hypothetical protein